MTSCIINVLEITIINQGFEVILLYVPLIYIRNDIYRKSRNESNIKVVRHQGQSQVQVHGGEPNIRGGASKSKSQDCIDTGMASLNPP